MPYLMSRKTGSNTRALHCCSTISDASNQNIAFVIILHVFVSVFSGKCYDLALLQNTGLMIDNSCESVEC